MRYKLILFIIGFLTALMGLLPLASNITAVAQIIGSFPRPGTLTYQLILFLLGIVAIGYSMKKEQLKEKRRER
jgi:hypothetical protein